MDGSVHFESRKVMPVCHVFPEQDTVTCCVGAMLSFASLCSMNCSPNFVKVPDVYIVVHFAGDISLTSSIITILELIGIDKKRSS